jgi:hypothetical protein
MLSIILKIHPKSQFVTTFEHNQKYYAFKRLPFGLSLAPLLCQVFTNYIVRRLRQLGATFAWGHMDDVIGGHHNEEQLAIIAQQIYQELLACGILLNMAKTILTPQTCIPFLGAEWSADQIERTTEVTKTMLALIQQLHVPHSYKQAQRNAGYLLYYLEFAGRNHWLTTFYLNHHNTIVVSANIFALGD